MIAFVIWTVVVLVFVAIGISSWKADVPVGFFTGVKPPEIPAENIKNYNHSVAVIWFVFSILFEIIGIPLLFFKQNSPYFIFMALEVPALIIGIIIAYLRVQNRYIVAGN